MNIDMLDTTIDLARRRLKIPIANSPQVIYGIHVDIYRLVMSLGYFFNPSTKLYVYLNDITNLTRIAMKLCSLRIEMMNWYKKYYRSRRDVYTMQMEMIEVCIEFVEKRMR